METKDSSKEDDKTMNEDTADDEEPTVEPGIAVAQDSQVQEQETEKPQETQGESDFSSLSRKLVEDAMYNEMETKYVKLEEEHDSLRTVNTKQMSQITELQEKIQHLQAEISSKENSVVNSDRKAKALDVQLTDLQELKNKEGTKLDQMHVDNDKLRETISTQQNENISLKSKIKDLESSANFSNTEIVPLRYEKERLKKELEAVNAHTKWLETELSQRNQSLVDVKAKYSESIEKLNSQYAELQNESNTVSQKYSLLQKDNDSLAQELEQLHLHLNQQKKESKNIELQAEEEVLAEKQVGSLLKEKCDRLEQRCKDAHKTLEQFQDMANKAAQSYSQEKIDLEEKFDKIQTEQEEKIEQLTHQKEQLQRAASKAQKELQDVKDAKERRKARVIELSSGKSETSTNNILESETTVNATIEGTPLVIPTPVSLSDLYDRLAETEDELKATEAENKRLGIYVQRILAEIEGNAPTVRMRQKEHYLAVTENVELKKKHKSYLRKMTSNEKEIHELNSELNAMQKAGRELQLENHDLATQVQTLLSGKAETSNDLVQFKDVQEMQQQNQKLLKENHVLKESVTDLEKQLDTNELQRAHDSAVEELESMREERERQMKLVTGIVQQRDMYRALVAQSSGDEILAIADKETETAIVPRKDSGDEVIKLKADLTTAENKNVSLEERLKRSNEYNKSLTAEVSDLNSKLTRVHGEAARDKADATYHSEKCQRLEGSVEKLRNEVAMVERSKAEFKRVNESLSGELVRVRAEASKHQLDLSQTIAMNNRLEAQYQSAQAAESRLTTENETLRLELGRQGDLLNSVQRIEASVSARSSQDMEKLEQEKHQLENKLKEIEVSVQNEKDATKDEITALGLKITVLEKAKDDSLEKALRAKDELSKARDQLRFFEEKSNTLEKDLGVAQSELETYQCAGGNAQKEQIASLKSNLQSTESDLTKTKERIATYQEIAKKAEENYAELVKATELYKTEQTSLLQKMKEERDALLKDGEIKQAAVQELSKNLNDERMQRETKESELNAQITVLQNKVEVLTEDLQATNARLSSLTEEISGKNGEIDMAQKNYERELDLHSKARTEIRNLKAESESISHELQSVKAELVTFRGGQDEEKKSWETEKSKFEDTIKEVEESLKNAREQNSLLHNQMATLTETVENFQKDRIANAGDEAETVLPQTEKTVTELREIIKFIKQEDQILIAQRDAARREADKERAISSVAKRSLDESRSENELLKKRLSNIPGNESDKENYHVRNNEVDQQLAVLKESNAFLREDFERLKSKQEETEKELGEAKQKMTSSVAKMLSLETDKQSLTAEKESLKKDRDSWKDRMQSFVTKFNTIDPEEHRQLQEKKAELTKELESLKNLKDQTDKEYTNAKNVMGTLNAKLAQEKKQHKGIQEQLEKIKKEKESLMKLSSDQKKERLEMEEKMKKMKTDSESEISNLKTRVENLTRMLKQYKKSYQDLAKKEQEAQSAVKALKDASQKRKLAAVVESPAPAPAPPTTSTTTTTGTTSTTSSAPKTIKPSSTEPKTTTTAVVAEKTGNTDAAKEEQATSTLPSSASTKIEIPAGGFKFAPSSSNQNKTTSPRPQATEPPNKKSKPVNKAEPTKPTEDVSALKQKLMQKKRLLELKKAEGKAKSQTLTPIKEATASSTVAKPSSDSGTTIAEKAKENTTGESATTSTEVTKPPVPAPAPTPSLTQSVFGSSAKLGSSPNPFAPKTSKTTPTFGSVSGGFGSKATTKKDGVPSFGAFLNLKPPGSSTSSAPLTFGSSSSIKLPTPAKTVLTPSSSFGSAFGSAAASSAAPVPTNNSIFAAGSANAVSIFGDKNKKRPLEEEKDLSSSKQARVETADNTKNNGEDEKEEGEE